MVNFRIEVITTNYRIRFIDDMEHVSHGALMKVWKMLQNEKKNNTFICIHKGF